MPTEKTSPSCPKCDKCTPLDHLGRRYAMYPAGCVAIFGLPYAALHQAQQPTLYKCQICQTEFGVRSVMSQIFRGLFIMIVALPLLAIMVFIYFLI